MTDEQKREQDLQEIKEGSKRKREKKEKKRKGEDKIKRKGEDKIKRKELKRRKKDVEKLQRVAIERMNGQEVEQKFAQMQEQIKKLVQKNAEAQSRADDLLYERTRNEVDPLRNAMLGKLTQEDYENIPHEEEKYHAYGSKTNVKDPMNKHQFCSLYKSIKCPCKTKQKKTLILIDNCGSTLTNNPVSTPTQSEEEQDSEQGKKKKRRKLNKAQYEITEELMKKINIKRNPKLKISQDIYISQQGLFVHSSYFANRHLRNKTSDEVVKELKQFAMCLGCSNHYGGQIDAHNYVDIMRRSQKCVICNKSSSTCAINSTENQVPVCNKCNHLEKQTKGCEDKLKLCLDYLKYIFPKDDVQVSLNHKIGDDTNQKNPGSNRYADCIVKFQVDDYYGIVIVECDEDSHKSYRQEDETKKFIQQSKNIIVQGMKHWQQRLKEVKNVKIMYLKYNPNKPYMVKDAKGNWNEENLTSDARLLAIRQHIIAFKLNLSKVRNFIVLYAFYKFKGGKDDYEKIYYPFYHNYSGCKAVYQCPASEVNGRDWEYCADVTETFASQQIKKYNKGKYPLLAKLQFNRVKWSTLFPNDTWRFRSTQTKDMFPQGIREEVFKLVPELLQAE